MFCLAVNRGCECDDDKMESEEEERGVEEEEEGVKRVLYGDAWL